MAETVRFGTRNAIPDSHMGTWAQVLGSSASLPWNFSRELGRKQNYKDLTQQSDMGCSHNKLQLNMLPQNGSSTNNILWTSNITYMMYATFWGFAPKLPPSIFLNCANGLHLAAVWISVKGTSKYCLMIES